MNDTNAPVAMTPKQALTEARRRWGKTAAIEDRKRPTANLSTKIVGHIALGLFFHVEGEGDTWEAAFKNVDDKKLQSRLFPEAANQPCPMCFRTMSTKPVLDGKITTYPRYPKWSNGRFLCKPCAEKEKAT